MLLLDNEKKIEKNIDDTLKHANNYNNQDENKDIKLNNNASSIPGNTKHIYADKKTKSNTKTTKSKEHKSGKNNKDCIIF